MIFLETFLEHINAIKAKDKIYLLVVKWEENFPFFYDSR